MHRLSASENQDGAVALAPGVPVAVAKPRRTINPIFPILCLGLVLFLIAATIVLALIPVYVSRRNIEPVDPGTAQFSANITLRNGSLPIGPLSSENCARIQNTIREQAAASSNVRPSVPTVTSCEVIGNTTTSSGRKKRQSSTTAVGNTIQIIVVLSPGNCLVNSCIVRRAQALIFILLNLGDFVLNLIINGSNVVFAAAFTSASSVIPVTTVSPSQTTTVATGTTAVGNNPNVTFLGVTNNSRLLVFNALNPSAVVATIPITNVLSGDIISNIDFRPATGELYGTANRQLYAINLNTGSARPIGGTLDSSVRGNIASMEFDPVYDVLRYVTDQGDRVTVDPEFGTLFYPTNLVNSTDKIISVGYANNLAGSSKSDLYGINITEDALYRVDFNNNGTITKVGSGLGVSVDDGIGFDISPEGIGIACVQIGSEQVVFSVDLVAGTFSKRLGVVTQPILSLAIPTAPVGYAVLKTNSSLVFANLIGSEFKYNYKTITGLQPNETIYSIDMRPFNGQLFGLGSSNRLYAFDLGTAEAYFPGNGNPLSPALRGTNFAIDFNPQVDRIRVVSDQGQNLVLNPDTGDVQSVSTDLNPANITITNIAYSNNVANATNTTLFDISTVLNQLFTQNPPNNGTLNSVGPLGITVQEDHGFDITSLSNTAVALLTVGGKVNLYEINQNTGVATLLPYSVNLSDVKSFALGFNL